MICRNTIFEVEQVKEVPLVTCLSTHHDSPPPPSESSSSRESCHAFNHEPFFDSIDPLQTWLPTLFCADFAVATAMEHQSSHWNW
jgi:hypothetical protein